MTTLEILSIFEIDLLHGRFVGANKRTKDYQRNGVSMLNVTSQREILGLGTVILSGYACVSGRAYIQSARTRSLKNIETYGRREKAPFSRVVEQIGFINKS